LISKFAFLLPVLRFYKYVHIKINYEFEKLFTIELSNSILPQLEQKILISKEDFVSNLTLNKNLPLFTKNYSSKYNLD
jgi:hypothetical protein